jgi:hypothetical protein
MIEDFFKASKFFPDCLLVIGKTGHTHQTFDLHVGHGRSFKLLQQFFQFLLI